MTATQRERIAELRQLNYSYRFIGDTLGLSSNTVKSICRRKHIEATGPRKTKLEKQNAPLCKFCHAVLSEGRKDRAFCSEECRMNWWKTHRKVIEINP